MNESEVFEHYEKLYFYELARKDQIFSRLNIPLVVIVAMAGFYAVILGSDRQSLLLGGAIWFWIMLSMSGVLMLAGLFFFVDALLGRMDKVLATPNDLEAWRMELKQHYLGENDPENKVAAEFRRAIFHDYMSCATVISTNNDRKVSSLFYCSVFTVLAVIFAVMAFAIVKFPTL